MHTVLAQCKVVQIEIRYLCQLTSAGCNDIDVRKSSWRTCITAGNVLGETCPLCTHQFFSNLLSPHSSGYSNTSPTFCFFFFFFLHLSSLALSLKHKYWFIHTEWVRVSSTQQLNNALFTPVSPTLQDFQGRISGYMRTKKANKIRKKKPSKHWHIIKVLSVKIP